MLLELSLSVQSFEYFCRIPSSDEKYMLKCLTLAKQGLGNVSPNPLVGCVIVHDNQIIGSGFHEIYGGPHAEVNAIRSVENQNSLRESTVYVNLEPCAHYGKTPPCASLLIEKKVKRVVVGMTDPYPEVSGKGIAMLREAGIEVATGVLEKEAKDLNRRFVVNQVQKRPYIILKWALSKDGFIHGEQKQISGLEAQKRLHQWRSEEDAFFIGTNTLLKDNPALNNRLWTGSNPIRVAIDFELKSQQQPLKFYDQTQKTIILNGIKDETIGNITFKKIISKKTFELINALYTFKIGSVVIEGGTQLLQSFIDEGLFDEIRIFTSKHLNFQKGLKGPKFDGNPIEEEDLGDDVLKIYR
jgi:diaminohydroxyphosphoribosylaminopyrimidine deaminase / 5-amino-6-(5-phosphoribosylamino)uracil reductase